MLTQETEQTFHPVFDRRDQRTDRRDSEHGTTESYRDAGSIEPGTFYPCSVMEPFDPP